MDDYVKQLKANRDFNWQMPPKGEQNAISEPCRLCRFPIGFGEEWRVYPGTRNLVHRSCDERESKTYGPWVPEHK